MKSFLLISYFFPPVGGAGVQRPLKLARYIVEQGWRPVVLAARRPPAPVWDPTLLEELPPEVRLYPLSNALTALGGGGGGGGGGKSGKESAAADLKRRLAGLLFPDPHVLWLPTALPGALAAVRREKPRAILVTAPPFSSFLLAQALARLTRLPLILDFRDEWSGFYAAGFDPRQGGGLKRRLAFRAEAAAVAAARVVLAASPAYCRRFRELYGGPLGKYLWLPNGYDPADFPPDSPPPPPDGKFTLVYTGTVFGVTSLRHLWDGLALLDQTERRRIRVEVAGRGVGDEVLDPALPGLEVRVHGYLDHGRAVALMRRASALVLTLEDLPGSRRVIPGKLYEYLAARRPVLCLAPAGVTASLAQGLKAGAVVHPGRPQQVADTLRRWLNDPPPEPPMPPAAFTRQEQAARLARILDRVGGREPDL